MAALDFVGAVLSFAVLLVGCHVHCTRQSVAASSLYPGLILRTPDYDDAIFAFIRRARCLCRFMRLEDALRRTVQYAHALRGGRRSRWVEDVGISGIPLPLR